MKTKKGCITLGLLFAITILGVVMAVLMIWYVKEHPLRFEYTDSKGETHIASFCTDSGGWFKSIKPTCTLEDGTRVFDVVSYRQLGEEE